MAYNVELCSRKEMSKVVKNQIVPSEREAVAIANEYAAYIREHYPVVSESNVVTNPHGVVLQHAMYTDDQEYEITTSKI